MTNLLTIGNDPKTIKGEKRGVKTAILYLAPVRLAGGVNVCPFATPGCAEACLNTAGRGAFTATQEARIRRTRFYLKDRDGFMHQLMTEIRKFVDHCERKGWQPAVRLNGTSDIAWERIPAHPFANIMLAFPEVSFYDYTKWSPGKRLAKGPLPRNYTLTYSFNEDPNALGRAADALRLGWNVAVVYDRLPGRVSQIDFRPITGDPTIEVVDGDADDLRFLDQGQLIGLKAKGKAKKDTTGFVVRHG